jgi:hypothetical protein
MSENDSSQQNAGAPAGEENKDAGGDHLNLKVKSQDGNEVNKPTQTNTFIDFNIH